MSQYFYRMIKFESKQPEIIVCGLMSGTSLDGTDLAMCRFHELQGQWKYEILACETFPYPESWEKTLQEIHEYPAIRLLEVNAALGKYFGNLVKIFSGKQGIKPHLVSSHGHTVFHQPSKGFTYQAGSGSHLAAESGIDTVCDFRNTDIALGGQGAPLVPAGDEYLFTEYAACLNLGGIANISFKKNNKRIAFDICPVNMMLNYIASFKNLKYDEDGKIAASGALIPSLLSKLNSLEFYSGSGAKSLGREWFSECIQPLLDRNQYSTEDMLHTSVIHIAQQIGKIVNENTTGNIIVTGGGALNKYLIETMQKVSNAKLELPSAEIINFKEALIFAFLGNLFINNRINVLSSATGSLKDHYGGAYYRA